MLDLLHGEAEMSAAFRAFDDDGVRLPVIFAFPGFHDDFKGTSAGNDGNQRNVGITHEFRQRQRQSGAGNDEVDSFPDRRPDDFLIIGERDHDIHSERLFSIQQLLRLPYFIGEGIVADVNKMNFTFFDVSHSDAGNRSESSLFNRFRRQCGRSDADSHARLDDRIFGFQISDSEFR